MRTKHTPGPWDVEYENADYNGGGQWYNAGPAKVWFPYNVKKQEEDEAKANAYLIAAAPELLEVLRDALDSLDYVERTLPGLSGYGVRQERIQKARAAIAKATGEQQ